MPCREEATERHRAIEDRLMRQKAHMLHAEAATWSLIWHLFGKGNHFTMWDAIYCSHPFLFLNKMWKFGNT